MTINFSTPHDNIEMRPRISVVGVGGVVGVFGVADGGGGGGGDR